MVINYRTYEQRKFLNVIRGFKEFTNPQQVTKKSKQRYQTSTITILLSDSMQLYKSISQGVKKFIEYSNTGEIKSKIYEKIVFVIFLNTSTT